MSLSSLLLHSSLFYFYFLETFDFDAYLLFFILFMLKIRFYGQYQSVSMILRDLFAMKLSNVGKHGQYFMFFRNPYNSICCCYCYICFFYSYLDDYLTGRLLHHPEVFSYEVLNQLREMHAFEHCLLVILFTQSFLN